MSIRDRIELQVKTMIAGIIAAVAATVSFWFAVVGAFLWAQSRYDTIVASWLAAGIFLLVALIALVSVLAMRKRAETRRLREEAEAAAAAPPAWLSDPATLVAAVQVARSVGLGRLVPFVIAGVAAFSAASFMGGRKRPSRDSGKSADTDQDSGRAA